jgi:hypothetical protein
MGASRGQAFPLAEAIYARHEAAGDPGLEAMPAPSERPEDLLALAGYLTTHGPMPADIPNALTIVMGLYRVLDRYQLALLHAGTRHGLRLGAMAQAIGVRDRRGVDGRIIRLEAAADGRVRIEKREREYRAGDIDVGRWLKRERGRIRRAADALMLEMGNGSWWSPDASDWAEDLEMVLRLPDPGAGEIMVYLSLLAKDWRSSCPGALPTSAVAEMLALAGEYDSVQPDPDLPTGSAARPARGAGGRRSASRRPRRAARRTAA